MDELLVIVGVFFTASIVSAAFFLIALVVSALLRKNAKKYVKGLKISLICFAVAFVSGIIIGAVLPDGETDTKPTTETTATATEAVASTTAPTEAVVEFADWRDDYTADLVAEIEAAFSDIGEKPENIISVEYVDTHTSGYVFERKCYKVEFKHSLGNPGWKHAREYRIMTQNYFEGEPEKEQYPDEFLITIKFWAGDDGHGTNINQWSWTGGGELQ